MKVNSYYNTTYWQNTIQGFCLIFVKTALFFAFFTLSFLETASSRIQDTFFFAFPHYPYVDIIRIWILSTYGV